jgi:hypothetical protein
VARRSPAALAGTEVERPTLSRAAGRFVRENSLSLFFLTLFLVSLAGQSVAGHLAFNAEQAAHGAETIAWPSYLVSSHFGSAVLENWQSEFLQFTFFILATVWLVQRGSPESKRLEQAGTETKKEQKLGYAANAQSPLWARVGGWRTTVYANSLAIAMTSVFFASWAVQSLTGWREYNGDQAEHGEPGIAWASYLARSDFWEKTLQNWQSEFLAVGTMVVFSIYLRQRGSPESKPVGAPHDETGSTG